MAEIARRRRRSFGNARGCPHVGCHLQPGPMCVRTEEARNVSMMEQQASEVSSRCGAGAHLETLVLVRALVLVWAQAQA